MTVAFTPANSADPDEMRHSVASHQDLQCLSIIDYVSVNLFLVKKRLME